MNAFDKIKGYKEEKEELIAISNLIKNREKLYKMGGKLPRGLFLEGHNGVGKTVLAKAFIEESNCNVVTVSYNDIKDDDEFTPYIKSKFSEAADKVPCIIFIDELDKLIGFNTHYYDESNFKRNRIVLNEINRYVGKEGLFLLVVANTNTPVDRSITRSGRIDKVIKIDLPNEKEREEIIHYYMSNIKVDGDIDYRYIAKCMQNVTGADIESIVNNAIIKAFGSNREYITGNDITEEYCALMFKASKKESLLDKKGNELVAYHEAGHAVVASLLEGFDVHYATILPRRNTRGFIMGVESDENIETLESNKNQVKVLLAGMASEELFTNDRSLGNTSDINEARRIITSLVRHHGFYGFEYMWLSETSSQFSMPGDVSSEARRKETERMEDELLYDLYKETMLLLKENASLVKKMKDELLKKKTLNRDDIDDIMNKKKKGPNGLVDLALQPKQEELRDAHN